MARGRHPTRIHIAPPDEQTAAKYLHCWNGSALRSEPENFKGLTSQELFGNNHPLEIDFGCGTGVLSCSRAQQYPEVNFIGIDQSQKPLFCAIRDAVAQNIENVKFIRGDLNLLLSLLRPQTVRAAYYLFPNPPLDYLRERANLRRRAFLQAIYNALTPGGYFFFATDSGDFFECLNSIITTDFHFNTTYPPFFDFAISTRYHRIWEERGLGVRCLLVEKTTIMENVQ